MTSKPRVPVSLIAFVFSYWVVIGATALGGQSVQLITYTVLMVVCIVVIFVAHRAYNLTTGLLWCFAMWGFLHMLGGLVGIPQFGPFAGQHGVIYSLALVPNGLKYDQAVHAFGFGTAAWACWEILERNMVHRHGLRIAPSFWLLVLCAAGGMGIGALNEVVEFAATRVFPETNVGGYVNTGWDLVYNMLGAVVAVLCIRWRYPGERGSSRDGQTC